MESGGGASGFPVPSAPAALLRNALRGLQAPVPAGQAPDFLLPANNSQSQATSGWHDEFAHQKPEHANTRRPQHQYQNDPQQLHMQQNRPQQGVSWGPAQPAPAVSMGCEHCTTNASCYLYFSGIMPVAWKLYLPSGYCATPTRPWEEIARVHTDLACFCSR